MTEAKYRGLHSAAARMGGIATYPQDEVRRESVTAAASTAIDDVTNRMKSISNEAGNTINRLRFFADRLAGQVPETEDARNECGYPGALGQLELVYAVMSEQLADLSCLAERLERVA